VRASFVVAAVAAFALAAAEEYARGRSPEPISAATRLYYGPDSDLAAVDAGLVDSAKNTIDMAAYVLTDRAVIAALGRAAERGVRVRLYLDGEESRRAGPLLGDLAATRNVVIKRKHPSRDLMHLKSYQIDGRLLRSGSANFSVSAAQYQDNDLVVIDSRAAAGRFAEEFERIWARPDNQSFQP